jgi:hypothetical protein
MAALRLLRLAVLAAKSANRVNTSAGHFQAAPNGEMMHLEPLLGA